MLQFSKVHWNQYGGTNWFGTVVTTGLQKCCWVQDHLLCRILCACFSCWSCFSVGLMEWFSFLFGLSCLSQFFEAWKLVEAWDVRMCQPEAHFSLAVGCVCVCVHVCIRMGSRRKNRRRRMLSRSHSKNELICNESSKWCRICKWSQASFYSYAAYDFPRGS